jgi:hypothetical protein
VSNYYLDTSLVDCGKIVARVPAEIRNGYSRIGLRNSPVSGDLRGSFVLVGQKVTINYVCTVKLSL